MYIRLGWSNPAATELVNINDINTLELLRSLNDDRVKSIVKAICHPGGDTIGKDVSENAQHNLIVGCFICKYWCRCSRDRKIVCDMITTSNLFEEAER